MTASATVSASLAYDVARQVELLPKWVSGLAAVVHRSKERGHADSPMGRVRLEMAPENSFGVLDHDVTLPDGLTAHNAVRVTPVDDGNCVFTFVVIRQADATADEFEADVALAQRALHALTAMLEAGGSGVEMPASATAGPEGTAAGRIGRPESPETLLTSGPPGSAQFKSASEELAMPGIENIDFEPPRVFDGQNQ